MPQFVHYDEDLEEELMPPTDNSILSDPGFRPWVELYAKDKDRFSAHFAAAFARLVELGIQREETSGIVTVNSDRGEYHSAPKKSARLGKEIAVGEPYEEAETLREENSRSRASL